MNNRSTHPNRAEFFSAIPYFIGPALTLLIGASLSIGVYSLVRNWEQSKLQYLFEVDARNRLVSLQFENTRHQDLINSVSMLFSSSENVTRSEFNNFTQSALSRQSSIQALEWIPFVKHSERDRYTQKAIDDGFTDFEIKDLNADGYPTIAEQRENYMPVFYLEPLLGNEPALGFNIASHPARLSAIKQARDTGQIISSERIKLVQEKHDSFGYLLFKAVYKKGESLETVEQRRTHFLGLATGVFRFKHLMPALTRNLPPAGMDVLILDQISPIENQLLHFHSSRTRTKAVQTPQIDLDKPIEGIHWKTSIKVLNRNWTILFLPAPVFFDRHRSWQAWTILIAGSTLR